MLFALVSTVYGLLRAPCLHYRLLFMTISLMVCGTVLAFKTSSFLPSQEVSLFQLCIYDIPIPRINSSGASSFTKYCVHDHC